jgi:hypothetical protein
LKLTTSKENMNLDDLLEEFKDEHPGKAKGGAVPQGKHKMNQQNSATFT